MNPDFMKSSKTRRAQVAPVPRLNPTSGSLASLVTRRPRVQTGDRAIQLGLAVPPLRVVSLGAFRLAVGHREVQPNVWKSRKAELLFKYLIARGHGRAVPKDAVLEALWPEQDPKHSDQCLRAAVTMLRRTLQPDLPARMPSAYVTQRDGRCTVRLGDGGYLDVAEFTAAIAGAEERERSGKMAEAAEFYRTALALYGGDFLEDEPYAEWAFAWRERLRDSYVQALLRLGSLSLHSGDLAAASALGLRVLEADDGIEAAYRLIIESYARSGQWGRVKVIYDRYVRILREYDLPLPHSLRSFLDDLQKNNSRDGNE